MDQFILYGLLEYEYEENYESIFSRIKHCKSVKKYIFRYMDIVGISNDQYKDYAYVGGLLYGIFINKIPHYVLGNDIYKEFLFILNDLLPEYKIYAMKKAANEEMNSIENINDKEAVIDIDFDLMSGVEFEEFLGEKFREKGYRVQYTPTTGDQGADLIITKKGIKTVVQAKCYSNPVGNKAVQEVIAAKTFYDANKAMVITNNSFTNAAIELAKGTGVTLWNGEDLKRLYR
ncbi:restriction endonuclease [Ligilactobacillus salivarius]|uniref:restriction endonuclease n=1 Tax=Ligilactobacillus salivarius TaxID=1624 RepID=UPI0001DD2D88|nr:restriction endonuclease [Ligilactobacillus salivarius]EFK79768.1 restriction endonuclease [Ligilactobacillus salivarius ACS-116-V-Col5a]